jgi:hypothetical protein
LVWITADSEFAVLSAPADSAATAEMRALCSPPLDSSRVTAPLL